MMGYGTDVKSSAANMQVFKQDVPQAQAGDNVGVQLRHVKLNQVRKGMILAKPGSFTPTNSFVVSQSGIISDKSYFFIWFSPRTPKTKHRISI